MFELKKVSFKNFFSYGNELTEIDFTQAQSFILSGRNGHGKCLDSKTELEIEFVDVETKSKFLSYHSNTTGVSDKIKTTLKEIFNFYKEYPECIGKINVETRFGFKSIEACEITSKNSDVYSIKTKMGEYLKTSPDHLLLGKGSSWKKVKLFKPNDIIFTRNGVDKVVKVKRLSKKQDLYDIQVKDVHEFYANNIVSHNSVILESIHYALFGKPYRAGLALEKIVNRVNKENCYVKLEFNSNGSSYVVERGIKPKLLKITKDNEILKENVSKKDFNTHLLDLIGLDIKVFSQLSIIDNSFYVPFMDLNASQRRALIDTVFGLDEIGDMLKKAREEKTSLSNDLDNKKNAVELIKEKIKINKLNSEEKKKKDLEEIDERISKIKDEGLKSVENLKKEKEALTAQEETKQSIIDSKASKEREIEVQKELIKTKQTKIQEHEKEYHSEEKKIQGVEIKRQAALNEAKTKFTEQISECNYKLRDIEKRKTLIASGQCSQCGQAFLNYKEELALLENDKENMNQKVVHINQQIVDSKVEINKPFDDEILSIKKAMGEIKDRIEGVNVEIKEVQETIKGIQKEIAPINESLLPIDRKIIEVSSQISFLEKTIRDLGAQIKTLGAKRISIENQTFPNLEGLEEELAEKEKEIAKSNTMLSGLIESEKILSDSGVRSYIITKFLPIFNATMKKYLDMMEANFSFSFDGEFESVSDDRFRNSMSYGSLSTGQRARVNFSIIFALIDFVEKKNNIKTNFIVLDEGLDGLDAEGRAEIFGILKNLIKKKLIVISHDLSIMDLFEKKLKVEMSGSFSKITWS